MTLRVRALSRDVRLQRSLSETVRRGGPLPDHPLPAEQSAWRPGRLLCSAQPCLPLPRTAARDRSRRNGQRRSSPAKSPGSLPDCRGQVRVTDWPASGRRLRSRNMHQRRRMLVRAGRAHPRAIQRRDHEPRATHRESRRLATALQRPPGMRPRALVVVSRASRQSCARSAGRVVRDARVCRRHVRGVGLERVLAVA